MGLEIHQMLLFFHQMPVLFHMPFCRFCPFFFLFSFNNQREREESGIHQRELNIHQSKHVPIF